MADNTLIDIVELLRTRQTSRSANGTQPSPAEGLRLLSAFLRISDRRRRAELIAMVEQIAKELATTGTPTKTKK